MKKIKITSETKISEIVEVTHEDGPDYPLLNFRGFDERVPASIVPTTANYPRKTESSKGNIDVLVASTREGWQCKSWPFSIFTDGGEEELFDHRHLLKAVKENSFPIVPVALYGRKKTGNDILDGLKQSSVLTLMGLFVNATDGTVNAVQNDFINVLKMVIEENNLPYTREVVNELISVTGVRSRYSHTATITAIKNAVLDRSTKSTKVFNTTKEEQQEWIKKNPRFGNNNYCIVDGVATRAKTIDGNHSYRYAGDILRATFQAWRKNEQVRFIVSSMAEHESDIENDRKDIIEVLQEVFSGPVSFLTKKIERFSGGMIKLPTVRIEDLPLEIWAMPQIQGEDEAIQLL